MAQLIVKQIPDRLNPQKNARQSQCPALLVQSECDSLVPTRFQDLIADCYSGELKKIVLNGADHGSPVPEPQFEEYIEAVTWLGHRVSANQPLLKTN